MEGGSVGFQIGASNTDIVMLVMNDRGMRRLLEDEFTLGSEATVAASPVGRQTSASTDVQMSAEIFSWSRSKGLFAGIALHGATLRSDNDVNQELYGTKLTSKEILTMTGDWPAPAGVMGLLTGALNRYSPRENAGRAQDQEVTDHNRAFRALTRFAGESAQREVLQATMSLTTSPARGERQGGTRIWDAGND